MADIVSGRGDERRADFGTRTGEERTTYRTRMISLPPSIIRRLGSSPADTITNTTITTNITVQ